MEEVTTHTAEMVELQEQLTAEAAEVSQLSAKQGEQTVAQKSGRCSDTHGVMDHRGFSFYSLQYAGTTYGQKPMTTRGTTPLLRKGLRHDL